MSSRGIWVVLNMSLKSETIIAWWPGRGVLCWAMFFTMLLQVLMYKSCMCISQIHLYGSLLMQLDIFMFLKVINVMRPCLASCSRLAPFVSPKINPFPSVTRGESGSLQITLSMKDSKEQVRERTDLRRQQGRPGRQQSRAQQGQGRQ